MQNDKIYKNKNLDMNLLSLEEEHPNDHTINSQLSVSPFENNIYQDKDFAYSIE